MAQRPRQAAEVVNLFGDDVAEEISVGRSPAIAAAPVSAGNVIDLSGKPTVVFVAGLGASGKTTWTRWATGELLARGSKARLVAIDPENRELRDYYDGVLEPPTHDPAGIAQWLKSLLDVCLREKTSALIDCGGGDAALGTLVSRTENLAKMMSDEGVEPVAVYPLSPRISDLSPLATLEAAGFKPEATLLILNEGRAENSAFPREQSFRQTTRHSAFRAAVDRGASVAWMPRLYVAEAIETRRITFREARDGIVPDGRKVVPLGVFDRSSVHKWLLQMAEAFAPYASWLP
jgi:hypothetical protein